MAAKVRLHHAGMAQLLRGPGVTRELERRGTAVLAAARASAPVDTGAYRDGLSMWTAVTDRTTVRIGSRDWKGHIIEAQTGNLSRALDAAGGA